MQNILQNLMQRCSLCWKVLNGYLSILFVCFSWQVPPLVFLLQSFEKIRAYKENSNISQGYEEGEKNFCIGNVIFIRFSLRATKYCRCIARRVGRDIPWRSVFQIKNLLNLTDKHLASNLSQQLYYEMNIKQQQNTSSNCFQLIMTFLGSIKLTTAALSPVSLGLG